MRSKGLPLMVACVFALAACESSTETTTNFSATMTGAKENPSVQTTGSGTFTATLNSSNVLAYDLTYTAMTSNVLMAHIHGPATTTENAGILVNLDEPSAGRTITLDATAGTGTGSINLSAAATATTVSGDSLRKLLNAGLLYVNVHTVLNTGGEIRGQITRD